MLCERCGERDAEKVVLIEADPPNCTPRSNPIEPRQKRAEALGRLCARCVIEVTVPPEQRPAMLSWMDEGQRMHAAGAAGSVSETLIPILDAVEREALHNPPNLGALGERLALLLRFFVTVEGRTHPNLYATSRRLASASNWMHVPDPYGEILQALSEPTMQAVWQPTSPKTDEVLPEQLLELLQRAT